MFAQLVLAQQQPNIIIILADDIGYGDRGSYGQKMIHTLWPWVIR
jgi:arylsulfatase A-like enzyme